MLTQATASGAALHPAARTSLVAWGLRSETEPLITLSHGCFVSEAGWKLGGGKWDQRVTVGGNAYCVHQQWQPALFRSLLEASLQYDEWEGEPSVGQLGTGMSDCVVVHSARTALCYAWKSDNQGPHSYDEANGVFKDVAKLFPGAEVVASDAFDDFYKLQQHLVLASSSLGNKQL